MAAFIYNIIHIVYKGSHLCKLVVFCEGSKSSTHYLGDKNRFDVSSKGPSSGISVPDEGPLLETSNMFLSPR